MQQRKKWYEKEEFEGEQWKTVIGSKSKYMISNYGRVKSTNKTAKPSFILPAVKNPKTNFLFVKVSYQGKYKPYKVDELVAAHFIRPPKEGEVVRHKNKVSSDNFAYNLEYVSREEFSQKRRGIIRTREVVQLDKESLNILEEYSSAQEAGEECGLSPKAILDCCRGRTKTSGGFIFKFVEDFDSLDEKGKVALLKSTKQADKRLVLSRSKAVVQLDKNTRKVINKYYSASEASRRCFISRQAILHCCHGNTKESGGYIFKFAEEYERLQEIS